MKRKRKRGYNFIYENKAPTEAEMKAYYRKRVCKDDPMANFWFNKRISTIKIKFLSIFLVKLQRAVHLFSRFTIFGKKSDRESGYNFIYKNKAPTEAEMEAYYCKRVSKMILRMTN